MSIIYIIFTLVIFCFLFFMFREFFYEIMEILIHHSCRYRPHGNMEISMKISTCQHKFNTMTHTPLE